MTCALRVWKEDAVQFLWPIPLLSYLHLIMDCDLKQTEIHEIRVKKCQNCYYQFMLMYITCSNITFTNYKLAFTL